MDFERLEKLTPEEFRSYLRTLPFSERLELASKLVQRLGTHVEKAFPEAHAEIEEGRLRSDRPSAMLAQSEIDRIQRM